MKVEQAASNHGVVAAGSPCAAEAGARVLRSGGNAADAAVATALALAVADPANSSLFGRCQALLRTREGKYFAIDGASRAPAATPPSAGRGDRREGYRVAPVPGLPCALERLHREHGRLPMTEVVAPAVQLARRGFVPPTHLADVWAARSAELRLNAPAREAYLAGRGDGGGSSEARTGEASEPVAAVARAFTHARLGGLIEAFGERGAASIMRGASARNLAHAIAAAGGYWSEDDLAAYAALDGEIVRGRFRDCEVATVGRQGWGHTVLEMLSILDALPPFGPTLTTAEAERLLLVLMCALCDRPQALGSLTPKRSGLRYQTLVDPVFTAQRARWVAEAMAAARAPDLARAWSAGGAAGGSVGGGSDPASGPAASPAPDRDTTHLSVIDRDGASVALTCSIGPHFGASVADPMHGVLLAHSYRMENDPTPGARDQTEMTPVIVTRGGRLVASLGASGSERIPGAIVQVLINLIDRKCSLAEAVASPRVNLKAGVIRVHDDAGDAMLGVLRARGYELATSGRGHAEHLGIVHACAAEGGGAAWVAAADPAWDGIGIGA